MSNKVNMVVTNKELRKSFFCLILLLVIFYSPSFDISSAILFLQKLVSFNSEGYQYTNPPIFFSIGEAISALAILFAVYQVKKEKWSLALRIRSHIEIVVIISIALSILFSIFSSLTSFVIPNNIFELSIFWQIASSILIAFSVIFLLKASNKNLFNKKSSRKFYEILAWEISRPDDERLNLALNVLLDNFENICKAVTLNDDSEIEHSARNILEVILSDRSVVKLITTKRFDGFMYIISVLKKYNISRLHSPKGIPTIFQGLFLDPESFLYKQLDNNGLALSANIYENIFESPQLLTNFDLFGYPTLGFSSRGKITSSTVSVFIEAISKSIKTYLKTGEVPAIHINNAISYLSSIFGAVCSEIKIEQEAGKSVNYSTDGNWWLLDSISHFFGHDYLFIGQRERFNERDIVLNEDIVRLEKTAKEANFNSHLAINEAIAAAIYKAFEQLSKIEKDLDTYHTVLNLLYGMKFEPNLKEGYMAPFTKRMWQQIGKNVIGKHYPMALKSYLNYIGFCLVGDAGQRTDWSGVEAEKMRRLLYVDLKPLLDANEKMVNDVLMIEAILPDCMNYKDGKFFYTMGFGRGPTEEILPPPEGSESALTFVDWQNAHHL